MQDAPTYYKDGVARVLEALKDGLGEDGLIRSYFNGETEEIGESQLPAIMVTEESGTIRSGATGYDEIDEKIVIVVAMNRKDDLGATPDTDLTEFKLRKLVKGQDPATGEYLPQTIMHILRTRITLDGAVANSTIRTDFAPYGGTAARLRGDSVTTEAIIELDIERFAKVPVRTGD